MSELRSGSGQTATETDGAKGLNDSRRPHPIFDAHLDLSLNAIEWNRDLTRPLAEVRAAEMALRDKPDRGRGTVSIPEMRRGRVGLCVATMLARCDHGGFSPLLGWRSQAQAWAMTRAQLAWYRAMDDSGEMRPLRNAAELERHFSSWQNATEQAAATLPIGYVLSLEGADSLRSIGELEKAVTHDGLRALGPAHYGPGVYAQGTDTVGLLPPRGVELIREMDRLGLILDVTHLSDESFWQALTIFSGSVWASHQNSRVLVPHQRQLSDEMFLALAARGAVVGVALDAWMLVPGWQRGKSTPGGMGVSLETLIDHIDHFCQLAGNARHVGLGSDLDGCFGTEQSPADLDSIAGLQRLPVLLHTRGYSAEDIAGILHGNFVQFLRNAWRGL